MDTRAKHSLVRRLASAVAVTALAFAGLTVTAAPANAAVILNANGVALKFNENNQVVDVIAGTTGSNRGTAAGDIVAYRNVATIGGTNVDAAVQTVSMNGATISTYDGTSAVSGANDYLQTNISTSGAGEVIYKFSFFVGGTYTGGGSGTPVILQNVYINSYDLDRSSPGDSQQFTQFTGVQAYTLSNNNTLAVSSSGNLLQFVSTARLTFRSMNGGVRETFEAANTGVVEVIGRKRIVWLLGGGELLREASLDAVRLVAMDDARLGGLVGGGGHGGRVGGGGAGDEALHEALEAGADDLVAGGASSGLADALLVSFDVGHVCQ